MPIWGPDPTPIDNQMGQRTPLNVSHSGPSGSNVTLLGGSILITQHDGKHSSGLVGIRGVFRPANHAVVVIVDLPEEPLSAEFETAKVMLREWVVVRREVRKTLDLDKHTRF